MQPDGMQSFMSIFSVFAILIYLGFIGLSIYLFILMVKLARRGIEALDIHLAEKRGSR